MKKSGLPSVAIIAACGMFVAVATNTESWWLQLLVFVCSAPVFAVLGTLPGQRRFFAGLVFFGAWLVPTTYWCHSFMPWWLAVMASAGLVAPLANLFHLFALQGPRETLTNHVPAAAHRIGRPGDHTSGCVPAVHVTDVVAPSHRVRYVLARTSIDQCFPGLRSSRNTTGVSK